MSTLWQSDDELFQLARRELFTAVVGDVMDKLGLQRQFLSPRIQPLRDDMIVLGRAMPVLEADVFAENVTGSANPLMQEILRPDARGARRSTSAAAHHRPTRSGAS